MPQNLPSCPMFIKNRQEIRLLGFAADFIYFLGRMAYSGIWLEPSVMLS